MLALPPTNSRSQPPDIANAQAPIVVHIKSMAAISDFETVLRPTAFSEYFSLEIFIVN